MVNKTFIRFLQEIAGSDQLQVSFPLTEYLEWAFIPFYDISKEFADVNETLRVLMEYKSTFEEKILFMDKKTYARVVPSFTTIGTMISVEFAEWTREVRSEEDWLLKIVEEMEKNNEHSRIY